eukprot:8227761-Pyramimonas_sp.AAC.1
MAVREAGHKPTARRMTLGLPAALLLVSLAGHAVQVSAAGSVGAIVGDSPRPVLLQGSGANRIRSLPSLWRLGAERLPIFAPCHGHLVVCFAASVGQSLCLPVGEHDGRRRSFAARARGAWRATARRAKLSLESPGFRARDGRELAERFALQHGRQGPPAGPPSPELRAPVENDQVKRARRRADAAAEHVAFVPRADPRRQGIRVERQVQEARFDGDSSFREVLQAAHDNPPCEPGLPDLILALRRDNVRCADPLGGGLVHGSFASKGCEVAGESLSELPQPRRCDAPALRREKVDELLLSGPLPEVALPAVHDAGAEVVPHVLVFICTFGIAAPERRVLHLAPTVDVEQGCRDRPRVRVHGAKTHWAILLRVLDVPLRGSHAGARQGACNLPVPTSDERRNVRAKCFQSGLDPRRRDRFCRHLANQCGRSVRVVRPCDARKTCSRGPAPEPKGYGKRTIGSDDDDDDDVARCREFPATCRYG